MNDNNNNQQPNVKYISKLLPKTKSNFGLTKNISKMFKSVFVILFFGQYLDTNHILVADYYYHFENCQRKIHTYDTITKKSHNWGG